MNFSSPPRNVIVEQGDICDRHRTIDLTVLPISAKMKPVEIESTQDRLDYFGLRAPADIGEEVKLGSISGVQLPTKNKSLRGKFVYAASVKNIAYLNKMVTIGEQLGELTQNDNDIRLIEAPFLGTGSGKLGYGDSCVAMAKGFHKTCHPDAVLHLYHRHFHALSEAEEALERDVYSWHPWVETDQIVVLIHGMNSDGEWFQIIREELRKIPGLKVEPISFSKFDFIRFLLPFFRQGPISIVRNQLNRIILENTARNKNMRISLICHSFGTYVALSILNETSMMKFDTVILCGSVVDRNFDFEKSLEKVTGPIINYAGWRDALPIIAKISSIGYDSSGTFGFFKTGVIDKFFDAKHSDFLTRDFARTHWIPLFSRNGVNSLIPDDNSKSRLKYPKYIRFLSSPAAHF